MCAYKGVGVSRRKIVLGRKAPRGAHKSIKAYLHHLGEYVNINGATANGHCAILVMHNVSQNEKRQLAKYLQSNCSCSTFASYCTGHQRRYNPCP
jgi:hypothetical protein